MSIKKISALLLAVLLIASTAVFSVFSAAKAVFPIKNTAAKHKANPFIQIPLFRFYYIMSLFLC